MPTMDRPDPPPSPPPTASPHPPIVRAVARVRAPHHPPRNSPHGGRGAAGAPRTRELTTRFVQLGPSARPVFVDDSGRRGRLLGRASVVVALIGLLLVVAFWLSQVTGSGIDHDVDACGAVAASCPPASAGGR